MFLNSLDTTLTEWRYFKLTITSLIFPCEAARFLSFPWDGMDWVARWAKTAEIQMWCARMLMHRSLGDALCDLDHMVKVKG